jgi:uncharacterized protein (TIGR03067 family)
MNDHDRLQGTWKVVEQLAARGKSVGATEFRLEFTGFTFQEDRFYPAINMFPDGSEKQLRYRFEIDATSTPKRIDWFVPADPFCEKGISATETRWQVYHGIYTFEGERLLLCFADRVNDSAPDAFTSSETRTAIVCERCITR